MEACNASGVESTTNPAPKDEMASLFMVGIILAVVGNTVIALSLSVQKVAHDHNQDRNGEPKMHFVKLPLWWCGIVMNILGEIGNLMAYGMAPAVIVAPLGSIGVLINQLLAVIFLKEPFRRRDVIGILAIMAGVVMIILAVPDTNPQLDVGILLSSQYFLSPRCYVYLGVLCLFVCFIIVCLEPTKGKTWILVWLSLCSAISSLTVVACRGFSQLVVQAPTDCQGPTCAKVLGHWQLYGPCMLTIGHWFFWVLLAIIVVTAIWSTMYLGKAMIYYGSTEVVPVYYCTFTFASIVSTGIIYGELSGLSASQYALFDCGTLLSLIGVAILMSGRKKMTSSIFDESIMGRNEGAKALTAHTYGT